MKRLFVALMGTSMLFACTDPNSEFYWEPAVKIAESMQQSQAAGTTGSTTEPVAPAETKPASVQNAIEETAGKNERVEVQEEEPAKADIEQVKNTDSGTYVCMLNDILDNNFNVIDPGTRGQIVHEGNKTYFVAGGKKYDITNVPAPTKAC